ncbi:MAG: hypothetical protein M0R80_01115 [Proteobacteria bacterium]|jgi:hypothetical protein|nr:hypothetical protein [Pseudomonadota bacterium]
MKFPHKATKKGDVWVHDFHDVLSDFFNDHEMFSTDLAGLAYHPVGNTKDDGNFIVIEHRKNHRPRYVGQFCVSETKIKSKAWKYKGRKYGYCIYQAADDNIGAK